MQLVATTGDQVLSFPLRQGSILIGRHSACHICIPSKTISRRHCQVYVEGATVVLRDLGSALGTYVNGARVERTELRDGDTIALGSFQLRYEAGEGAAGAAPAYAAAPAQDIVVTAEPAGPATPVEPVPLHEPQGVPPPTDFPEEPQGDETPVDAAFVPQSYTPPQPSMLPSATLQPQMVIRDGRWFLRDPRTGREVEVTPKAGAAVPAVAATPVEARRPNIRLLLAAIGATALLVLAFAFFLPQRQSDIKPPPAFPLREYYAIVDEAIALFRQAKYEPALAKLDRAERERSNVGAARLIAQYVRTRQAAGTQLEKFDWNEARRYLQSVLNIGSAADSGAAAFAQEQLNWVHAEQTNLGLYEEALALLRVEGDNDDTLTRVIGLLRDLPKHTTAAHKAEPKVLELKGRLADVHLGRARRARTERKWLDAVKHYQAALDFVDDPAPIRKQIAECDRFGRDAGEVSKAREEIDKQNFASARNRLAPIVAAGPPPSPYAEEAKGLLAQIETNESQRQRAAQRKEVLDLYEQGSGEESAKLAEKYGLTDLAYIKERVERWKQLMADAERAEAAKEYENAQATFQQALEVEPDGKNYYNRQANTRLQALKGRSPQIGAEFAGEAFKLVDADPKKARQLSERAQRFDPEQALAKKCLETLQRTANVLYLQADGLLRERKYDEARPKLLRARDCADPNSKLHETIRTAIDQLPKE